MRALSFTPPVVRTCDGAETSRPRRPPCRPARLRHVALASLLAVLALASAAAAAPLPTCLQPPVRGPVITPFQAPACLWCPGNRGIDYGTAAGATVRAAAGGTVTFAGSVAGARWVTVAHDGGMLTSYGPLQIVAVRAGMAVEGADVVGTSSGNLHFGVRIGGRYVDPGPLLGAPVHLVPRLVPLRGPIARPPALRCAAPGPPAHPVAGPARTTSGRPAGGAAAVVR